MRLKKRKLLFLFSLLLITLVPFISSSKIEAYSHEVEAPPEKDDMNSHPLYSRYKFWKQKQIVNIGIQPLYLPTGHIAEALERDLILQEILEKMGVEINFFPFLKGDDINYFVKSGDLDGGIIGDMATLSLASVKDIFVTTLVQRGNSSIIAGKNIWIDELKGKKIGYTPKSPGHYGLLKTLDAGKINESDLTLIPMDPHELPDAIAKGELDAFASGDPTVSVSLILNRNLQTVTRVPSTGFFFVTSDFFGKHQSVVFQITAAIVRAIRWMKLDNNNLLQAGEWAIEEGDKITDKSANELSAEHSRNLAIRDILGSLKFPTIKENDLKENSDLHKEFEFLRRKKIIPETSSWDHIKNSFNIEMIKLILSDPEKYRIDEFKYSESHKNGHYF